MCVILFHILYIKYFTDGYSRKLDILIITVLSITVATEHNQRCRIGKLPSITSKLLYQRRQLISSAYLRLQYAFSLLDI